MFLYASDVLQSLAVESTNVLDIPQRQDIVNAFARVDSRQRGTFVRLCWVLAT